MTLLLLQRVCMASDTSDTRVIVFCYIGLVVLTLPLLSLSGGLSRSERIYDSCEKNETIFFKSYNHHHFPFPPGQQRLIQPSCNKCFLSCKQPHEKHTQFSTAGFILLFVMIPLDTVCIRDNGALVKLPCSMDYLRLLNALNLGFGPRRLAAYFGTEPFLLQCSTLTEAETRC